MVLVDKEGACIFVFNLAGSKGITDVVGEDVKRHSKEVGPRQSFQRHEDEAAFIAILEGSRRYFRGAGANGTNTPPDLAGTDANVAVHHAAAQAIPASNRYDFNADVRPAPVRSASVP